MPDPISRNQADETTELEAHTTLHEKGRLTPSVEPCTPPPPKVKLDYEPQRIILRA